MSVIIVSFLEDDNQIFGAATIPGETIITANALTETVRVFGSGELLGETIISATASLRTVRVFANATILGETNITSDAQSISATATVLRGETRISSSAFSRLAIEQTPPILDEIDADAFTKQFYTARLLGDNIEIYISSASIEEPKGAVGKRVSCQIAKKDLAQITPAKLYKFQIGTRETYNGTISWETIVENAELDSRSFSMAWSSNAPSDNLSFSTIAPLMDRLNRFPLSNLIIYNPSKTEVNIDDSEKIRIDGTSGRIDNELIAKNGLTLYEVLTQVRKRIGFTEIITNIPNYEITRFDAPFSQSWNDSLRGLLGTFEVLPRVSGNVLEFLDKTQPVPEDFEPEILYVRNYRDINLTMPSGGAIDGFLVSYAVSETNANFSVERTIETTETTGQFGNPNYTRTIVSRTFRDWKNTADPDEVLRSDLIRERHSTYNNSLVLIGRDTNELSYDAQGKRTSSERTVESLVPNLLDSGTPALLETRIENQTISYVTDAKNPRRQIQNKTITQIRGLIANDAENQYFDEDFKQDLTEANKAGNLTATMTSSFGPIKTVTETLTPLGNNQFEVRVSTVDHLRNTTTNGTSEPKTGDAGLNSVGGKTKQLVILREGLTVPTGRGYQQFALGEFPLSLGKSLARRRLARIIDRKQDGSVNVIGYHSSVKRGVYFRIFDRAGANFGTFIAEGLRSQFDNLGTPNQTVITTIDISEI